MDLILSGIGSYWRVLVGGGIGFNFFLKMVFKCVESVVWGVREKIEKCVGGYCFI